MRATRSGHTFPAACACQLSWSIYVLFVDGCRRRRKANGQEPWEDGARLEDSMQRSDGSNEALIGVEPDSLDPELMQTNPEDAVSPHSSASSASLPLTEQYSVASCSYPPLDMSNLRLCGSGVLLSAAASSQDLEGSSYNMDETPSAEQSIV